MNDFWMDVENWENGKGVTIVGDNVFDAEVTLSMSANNQVKTRVDDAQERAFELARERQGDTKSDALREAMRLYCERAGIPWPEATYSHGDANRFTPKE